MIGSNALAVKWIDATRFAEVVARRHRVKTIFGEGVFSRKQLEPRLVDFHHQRILAATDRAVAPGELGEVALDFEPDGAAMATAFVPAYRSTGQSTDTQVRRQLPLRRRPVRNRERLPRAHPVRLLDLSPQ